MTPITFTLIVENLGVKYVIAEHAQYLVQCINKYYEVYEDWEGNVFCGITLERDYNNTTMDLSMSVYVQYFLQKCYHKQQKRKNMRHISGIDQNMDRSYKRQWKMTRLNQSNKK